MGIDTLPEDIYEFRNSYLHLVVDETAKLLYSEWVRKPTSEEYRKAATIFANCLRSKNIEFWIQDTCKLGEVTVDDLKWMLYELVPVAASSALKKLARISTDETNMVKFMNLAGEAQVALNSSVKVQQFKTYREAAEWIESKF